MKGEAVKGEAVKGEAVGMEPREELDRGVGSLILLSAALAVGEPGVLAAAIERAAAEADPLAVEEVLVQSYLFLGYPAALNALALWRERSRRRAEPSGAQYEVEPGAEIEGESRGESRRVSAEAASSSMDQWARWRARGEVVCARVYGGQYERLRENVARLHPDMAEWMVTEGYGKVLGRPGLALEVRELCIAVLLAGLDAKPQLRSHLRGSLLVGATPAQVEAALTLAEGVIPPARMSVARAIWGEVLERREARE